MLQLISVHFPKAAGSALRHAYEIAFGAERVLRDYNNDPVDPTALINIHPLRYEKTKPTSLNGHAVVHGHFHIGRYNHIKDSARVVVLRNPVENLVSIYCYWDLLRQRGDAGGHPLYQYFVEANLSIVKFATIPAIRDLMT